MNWKLLAGGVVVVVVACMFLIGRSGREKGVASPVAEPPPEGSLAARLEELRNPHWEKGRLPTFAVRAEDFTESQKAELVKLFEERWKPAVEKWYHAYEGRVPFPLEAVTFDKFYSVFTGKSFTFVIGDITLVVMDDQQREARVFYLMTRKDALQMKSIPTDGKPPDLSVPVSREEVIRMVKADTGVEFKNNTNKCRIIPSGASSSVQGGAFVEMVPPGAFQGNYEYNPQSAVSLVFGPDGKLVNYLRSPFF